MLHLSISQVAGPPNDDFGNASVVFLSEYQGFYDNPSNIYATVETGEPVPSCASGIHRTLWYVYTAADNGKLTGNFWGYAPFMAIYTRSNQADLQEVWCGVNQSINIDVVSGNTYYLQIGEMNAYSSGWFYISLNFIKPPANDDFANAKVFVLDENTPFSDNLDLTHATVESREPYPGCSYDRFRTIWYAFTPTTNGRVTGSYGGDNPFIGVYTGNSLEGLTSIWCSSWGGGVDFPVSGGTTYYIQLGVNYDWAAGWASLNLYFTAAPLNDNFANAMLISSLPYERPSDIYAATGEIDELRPSCIGDPYRTVWYTFTPELAKTYTAEAGYSWWWSFMAVYKEDSSGVITEVTCRNDYWGGYLTFLAKSGEKYYLQLGSSNPYDYGTVNFKLMETPPPDAYLSYWPSDPTIFDNISFYNNSNDPYGMGISTTHWDFGDGASSADWNPTHRYVKDGDYTVKLDVYTPDGRSASTTQTISVRTHDVAITKFTVPQSVSSNQSRTITVGLRNSRYPETVTVELYKSTPSGWQWVGTLSQYVPIRPANRTTDFLFKYTFTKDDAAIGKVTFRAVATIQGYRDALPADNEAISQPVKVSK
jgi:hypothetical protein